MAYGQMRNAGKPRLVGAIFTLMGLGLLGGAAYFYQRQVNIIENWPQVEAEVVRSEVTYHSNDDGTTYGVRIDFRFRTPTGSFTAPATLGYTTSRFASMQAEVNAHPPGSHHMIHYNPEQPFDIRFNAGYSWGFFSMPLILSGLGAVFFAVGLGILAKSRTAAAARCPACGRPAPSGPTACPHCGAALAPQASTSAD